MAGLPVLSTTSVGGRDVFYTRDNSVVVAPTVEAVTQGHARMKELLKRVDRQAVRDGAVARMKQFRATLGAEMQAWFDQAGIREDATAVLLHELYKGRYGETFLNAWSSKRLVPA